MASAAEALQAGLILAQQIEIEQLNAQLDQAAVEAAEAELEAESEIERLKAELHLAVLELAANKLEAGLREARDLAHNAVAPDDQPAIDRMQTGCNGAFVPQAFDHFSKPRVGELHLRPFLLPTTCCDFGHPDIMALSRQLIPDSRNVAAAAAAVRAWVQANVVYTLQDKSDLASDTLRKREGMCTNKTNLQVALLRAAQIPAAYVILHITKQAFNADYMLPEVTSWRGHCSSGCCSAGPLAA